MFYDFTKRTIDIIGSAVALVIFSPIIIAVSVLIKLTSPGPIFYNPARVGKNGKLFKMLKFRSMYMYEIKGKLVHAEKYLESNSKLMKEYQSNSYKLQNDPRITQVGKFLRKFSFDELPQLITKIKFMLLLKLWPRRLRYLPPYSLLKCHWQVSKIPVIEAR